LKLRLVSICSTVRREDVVAPVQLSLVEGRDGDARDLVFRATHSLGGGAVNIASRISGLSAPGEVLVSDTVRSLARTSASVSFEDRGEQALKGVGEPVRVWVVWEDDR
jgi:class 3 adenylate cyclase